MEKEKLFMNQATNGTAPMWNSSSFGMGMQSNDPGSCFFNSSWDSSMDQNDPFESALSPIVSSPLVSSANAISSHGGSGDTVTIRELIGRLGTICDSEEIFPYSSYINNTDNINNNHNANNSCYSTPLNSPPKLNLPFMDSHIKGRIPILGNNLANQQSLVPFPTDPVFAERAARYSCFANRNLGGLSGQFGLNQAELLYGLMPRAESGNISIVQSSNSMKVTASQGIVQESNKSSPQDVSSNSATKRNAELGDFNEKSSVSEQIPDGEMSVKGQKEYNPRKRKSIPRGKTKETPSPSPCSSGAKVVAENNDEPSLKKGKSDEANGKQKDAGKAKEEEQDGDQKKNKDSPKPAEPLKDYIHVRARRGQATDSHSLAERVRREKIGERMKFLQDLVPGCNKVTGKAVMLDEIINYVQSLQRQVEFLSMKLATVNPSMDFNMEALLSKQIFQSRGSVPNDLYPLDSSTQAFPYGYQSRQGLPLQSGLSTNAGNQFSLKRNRCLQLPPLNGFTDASRQVPSFWEDDLHSVVQMGYGQNQQSFQGSPPAAQMKLSCNSETTLQPSS